MTLDLGGLSHEELEGQLIEWEAQATLERDLRFAAYKVLEEILKCANGNGSIERIRNLAGSVLVHPPFNSLHLDDNPE